jgi:hypothetical protein
MSSEENEYSLIVNNAHGLVRRMDEQLELMNCVLREIEIGKFQKQTQRLD